ncbi:MAG: hypothetical protein Q8907_00255 [Bacteroidota bacterium]|nr:hypothetical protein [Bacteroidota bacterium]
MNKSTHLFDTSKYIRRNLPEQIDFLESLKNELPFFREILEKGYSMTIEERKNKEKSFLDKNWEAITMSGNIKGLLCREYPENIKIDKNGRFYFEKSSRYFIYFKKLNRDYLPSNISTEYTQKLYGQYALPSEKPTPIVFVGYQVDNSWENLIGCYAISVKNEEKLWISDLPKIDNINLKYFGTETIIQTDDLSSMLKIRQNKSL